MFERSAFHAGFRRYLFGTFISISTLVSATALPCSAAEQWPDATPKPEWQEQVAAAVKEYKEKKYDYRLWTQDYRSDGDYLRYSRNVNWKSPNIQMDADGLPMIKYGGSFEYNPVSICEFALSEYGLRLRDPKHDLSKFYLAADKLIAMQGQDGALRYNFEWLYYRNSEPYKSGWVSGMAQGMALSVLSRAYRLSKNHKYIDAGDKAFSFMVQPVSKGGTMDRLATLDPSLKRYIIFEEYISTPPNYTFNGYMFSLLGVYDWIGTKKAAKESSLKVQRFFNAGIETLVGIAPYYDLGGFSSYDLTHITFKAKPHIGVNYHLFHIALLHALYSVTYEPVLKQYEDKFISYVANEPKTSSAGDIAQ